MRLFAHHAEGVLQSLGLDIDINGEPFPNGPTEHVIALVVVLVMTGLMAYGAYALVRDWRRWRSGRNVEQSAS
jgi:hypothetical protein